MKYKTNTKPFQYRFDFEIGYLVKSPCRECDRRAAFPECMKDCGVLDRIHSVLAESISCSGKA